jgi:prevent-host-death family protein
MSRAVQVNVLEAKNQLSQLIRLAQAGDQVIIACPGAPVAQLIPVQAPTQPLNGDFLAWLASNRLPADAQRSAQEIDAAIADERAAWD